MMNKKNIFWLALVYCLQQWTLVLITGQWWDDWTLWTSTADNMKQVFSETGIPWEAYNLFSVMWIPNWGYRIVVFFLFMAAGLLFYMVLRRLDFLSEEDAFWMAAIAMTVPVNDAKATLICYGYSLSLPLYMLAFYIVAKLQDIVGWKRYVLRVFSLCCLFYSYTTQSLLVFTGLIWLYLFYAIWAENAGKKLRQKILLFFSKYWDYFFIPFAFYIVKGRFFKPYGRYENYNRVTSESFVKGTQSSLLASFKTGENICRSYLSQISVMSVIVFAAVMVIYLIAKRKVLSKEKVEKFLTRKNQLFILILGAVVYYAGIFAYIIVRGGGAIGNTGVGGRDAMLAGFGIGIMAVAFSRILPVKKTIQNLIPVFLVVFGIFHFNDWYLNYQEDWYHQQEFANAIEDNDGFADDNTILCDFTTASPIGGTRFYSLNGMSYVTTGKMDKFFFSGIGYLRYGMEFNEDFLNGYNADDYDYSDRTIDGVLLINNAPISNLRLLQIRLHEMFEPNTYNEDIRSITDYTYVRVTKETSDKIYELYSNGELTSDVLRELVSSYE